jgi:hypothetical protein
MCPKQGLHLFNTVEQIYINLIAVQTFTYPTQKCYGNFSV